MRTMYNEEVESDLRTASFTSSKIIATESVISDLDDEEETNCKRKR